MLNKIFVGALATFVILAGSTSAIASDRTYSVTAALTDGGSLTGTFTYNSDTDTYSAVNLTTTTGTDVTGSVYNDTNNMLYSGSDQIIIRSVSGNPSGQPGMYLRFSGLLDETTTSLAVNTALVNGTEEGLCLGSDCGAGLNTPKRFATSGSVTYQNPSVIQPIPTLSEWTMIMLAFTLAGMATLYIERRRRLIDLPSDQT